MSSETGGCPTIPGEDRVAVDLSDHGTGVVLGDRHDPEGDVLEHLGEDAAEAEHDHGPELRVLVEPDDHLRTAVAHLLDADAGHASRGSAFGDGGDDALVCGSYLLLRTQIELDTTRLGLVDDVRRDDLEGTGPADAGGYAAASSRVRGQAVGGRRETVALDNLQVVGHDTSVEAR